MVIASVGGTESLVKVQLNVNHRLVNGQEYKVKGLQLKLLYAETEMKYQNTVKRGDKESTEVKVFQEKGSVVWTIGELKKDEMVKNELKFALTKPDNEAKFDARFMSKVTLCVRFMIDRFNVSSLKLLKVDFVSGQSAKAKKYASEITRSGFFEVHLN